MPSTYHPPTTQHRPPSLSPSSNPTHSSRINLQRTTKIHINRIQLRNSKSQIRRRDLPLQEARIVLSSKLVHEADDALRRAREHAVLEVGALRSDADEAVGVACVAAEGDGIEEILVADFAADFSDRVGGDAGEPVVGDLLVGSYVSAGA